jgi:hypothetical protein
MADADMDKEEDEYPDLLDLNEVDLDGNPIGTKSAFDNEDQADLQENDPLTYDWFIPKPPLGSVDEIQQKL